MVNAICEMYETLVEGCEGVARSPGVKFSGGEINLMLSVEKAACSRTEPIGRDVISQRSQTPFAVIMSVRSVCTVIDTVACHIRLINEDKVTN